MVIGTEGIARTGKVDKPPSTERRSSHRTQRAAQSAHRSLFARDGDAGPAIGDLLGQIFETGSGPAARLLQSSISTPPPPKPALVC
jgi:hypothetical protein